jgi:hypothetical protein
MYVGGKDQDNTQKRERETDKNCCVVSESNEKFVTGDKISIEETYLS